MKNMKEVRQGPLWWGVIFFMTAGIFMAPLHRGKYLKAEESRVNQAVSSPIETLKIPPIDETAPDLVETASFGLG